MWRLGLGSGSYPWSPSQDAEAFLSRDLIILWGWIPSPAWPLGSAQTTQFRPFPPPPPPLSRRLHREGRVIQFRRVESGHEATAC